MILIKEAILGLCFYFFVLGLTFGKTLNNELSKKVVSLHPVGCPTCLLKIMSISHEFCEMIWQNFEVH